MTKSYQYKAFISYSHADKKWGDWLHKKLETYQIPKPIIGNKSEFYDKIPSRLFPIFRDREELATSSELGKQINEALELSSHLIVICSPRAANSRWVNQEILEFKRMGGALLIHAYDWQKVGIKEYEKLKNERYTNFMEN